MAAEFLSYITRLIDSLVSLEFLYVPVIVMGIFSLISRIVLRRF